MKGLTLTQPWATLVAIGAKEWETRSWYTPYRGRVAIHAAKGFPRSAREWADDYRSPAARAILALIQRSGPQVKPVSLYLPLGAVIATAELIDCRSTGRRGQPSLTALWTEDLPAKEFAYGDFSPGRFGWQLVDVRWLPEPVTARGSLGLWEVPADVLAAVEGQLAAA